MTCFTARLNELFELERDKQYPFSRVAYAKMLNVTHNQVSGWLDGRSEPNIETLIKIAHIHDVSLSWLVGETNIKNRKTFSPSSELIARIDGLPQQAIDVISNVIEMAHSHYNKRPLP